MEHTFTEDESREAVRYVGGGDRNIDAFLDLQPDYNGTMRFRIQDGQIFTFAIGSVQNSGSPNYLHTISETGGNLPWFAIEDFKGSDTTNVNLKRTLSGCVIDTFTVRGREGEVIEGELNYSTSTVLFASGARTSVTASTAIPYMWDDVLLTVSGAGLSGANLFPGDGSLTELKDFEWTINNNIVKPFYLRNSRFMDQPIPGPRDYSFNITLNLARGTGAGLYNNAYKTGSDVNMTLFVFRTSGADANSSADTFRIAMSGCKITNMDMPTTVEDVQETRMEIQPTACTVLFRDTTETYAYFL